MVLTRRGAKETRGGTNAGSDRGKSTTPDRGRSGERVGLGGETNTSTFDAHRHLVDSGDRSKKLNGGTDQPFHGDMLRAKKNAESPDLAPQQRQKSSFSEASQEDRRSRYFTSLGQEQTARMSHNPSRDGGIDNSQYTQSRLSRSNDSFDTQTSSAFPSRRSSFSSDTSSNSSRRAFDPETSSVSSVESFDSGKSLSSSRRAFDPETSSVESFNPEAVVRSSRRRSSDSTSESEPETASKPDKPQRGVLRKPRKEVSKEDKENAESKSQAFRRSLGIAADSILSGLGSAAGKMVQGAGEIAGGGGGGGANAGGFGMREMQEMNDLRAEQARKETEMRDITRDQRDLGNQRIGDQENVRRPERTGVGNDAFNDE